MRTIKAMYFSPTHTTEQIVMQIAERLRDQLSCNMKQINITKPTARDKNYSFDAKDILVLGLPVYAGRIPTVTENTIKQLTGDNTPVILITLYGNRAYDDTLLEMKDTLEKQSFKIIAAAAFIGEHSFSYDLAANRPDGKDMLAASEFATKIAHKIENSFANNAAEKVAVKGNFPYKERAATPLFAPKTTDECNECMICYNECPTDAIEKNPKIIDTQKCIRCCACVKSCPLEAKYFDHEIFIKSKIWLEENFSERKEPEFFI